MATNEHRDDDTLGESACASPPCLLEQLDPVWLGGLDKTELLALLNTLIEAERAGARGLVAMTAQAPEALRPTLRELAQAEAHWCACLVRHVRRLGDAPSSATGAFSGKLLAAPTLAARLDLLVRGQNWVTRRLGEALPRIFEAALVADLEAMRQDHERNTARCAELARQA